MRCVWARTAASFRYIRIRKTASRECAVRKEPALSSRPHWYQLISQTPFAKKAFVSLMHVAHVVAGVRGDGAGHQRGRFAEEDCVEIWAKSGSSQKRTKLFFVPGIDTSTEFAPQARKVGY